MNISEHFVNFTKSNNFKEVERSRLISKYFKNEFNLSGGHSHLVPAVLSHEKVDKEYISVLDLCIRKTDSQMIGVSNSHLLLFEMGVWGCFGYIDNKIQEEFRQLSLLLEFLRLCNIEQNDLYFTICGGGQYLDRSILPDTDSLDILLALGIKHENIFQTQGRRNFMLSRGIDRLAGYNIEVFVKRGDQYIEIASSNIYEYINKLTHLEKTVNTGIGCGIGIERVNFISEGLNSVYDLPFFKSSKEQIRQAMNLSVESINIISDKIYRLTELSKTLIFLLNDEQYFDKTAQGKTMKSYLSKIKSEISFLSLPEEQLFAIIRNCFDMEFSKYNIDSKVYSYILEAIKL